MLGRYQDIESVTCIWVGVEEIKRLGLALYKVCKICRSTSQGGLQEGSGSRLLRLSDLRFPAPDSNDLWEAGSNPELSHLLSKIHKHRIPEESGGAKWISESGGWLDSVDPGFDWI